MAPKIGSSVRKEIIKFYKENYPVRKIAGALKVSKSDVGRIVKV